MKLFEIKKPDYVSLSFSTINNKEWKLNVSYEEKAGLIFSFCIDLCIQAKIRDKENKNELFSELETLFLLEYFKRSGFMIECRDKEIEKKLKDFFSTTQFPNLQDMVECLSYNEQVSILEKILKNSSEHQ